MKITEKKFKVMQLTDNRQDYVVLEMFYILGFNFSYVFHYNDNKAFKSVFSAIKAKDRLVAQEKKKQVKRNLTLITLTIILCVSTIMALK